MAWVGEGQSKLVWTNADVNAAGFQAVSGTQMAGDAVFIHMLGTD